MIELSYIIATRNRLLFLRITLERLIANLQPGEEIVVVDGDSRDGSKEYLQGLYTDGRIQQFISEPDKNQAHGWNKAMLIARGEIIKKIIDDDVFCYAAIRQCKAYMLQHSEVDVVISNDLGSSLNNPAQIEKYSRLPQFSKWQQGDVPSFTFGDVHMLIRRSALAYVGLYNTSFVMMDWEYSLRISYLKASIIYYTGYNALSVAHEQSVTSHKNQQLVQDQGKLGMLMYNYAGDGAEISNWSKLKIFAGKKLYGKTQISSQQVALNTDTLKEIYNSYYLYIDDCNMQDSFEFITGT
ncbi:glycosyltransferase [Mucilaginibacter terrenus]|uniref:Glycosyltransferase n=1 Tax=Mucilaginibacter terrenus TaxID=2482727 RepID=A0A3E2NMK4_9SPHI|nr:glycosyltransferase [Mucilaginibacter terrenus]RFZ82234.1 glycosyltransferase [Mucilaginibacter terrenus]